MDTLVLPPGLVVHQMDPSVVVQPMQLGNLSGVRFFLPLNNCSLVYFPWPEEVPYPIFDPTAGYNDIFVHGRERTQPRRTLCYGTSYKYSGIDHKLEETTPDDIMRLLNYTRNIYTPSPSNLPSPGIKMMCLANKYQTGYHAISKHSDKEGQFAHIRDIWCWVVGEPRRIVIRTRPKVSTTTEQLVLSVSIPTGIYVMQGEMFQRTYTHEIPREKESLFNKLSIIATYEVRAAGKLHIADWLAWNPQTVSECTTPQVYQEYVRWSNPRCSYTIRFFADQH